MRADSVKEMHCHCQGHADFQLDQTNWCFTNDFYGCKDPFITKITGFIPWLELICTLASGRLLHLVVKFGTAYLSAVVAHHLDRDRWEK